ncbi:MAG: hypothetical protein U0892_20425 [Pirellulales bacterium]
MSSHHGLSYQTRKALCVQLGEAAGNEIANLLQRMAAQIEELKRSKVNVTQVVPAGKSNESAEMAALEYERF